MCKSQTYANLMNYSNVWIIWNWYLTLFNLYSLKVYGRLQKIFFSVNDSDKISGHFCSNVCPVDGEWNAVECADVASRFQERYFGAINTFVKCGNRQRNYAICEVKTMHCTENIYSFNLRIPNNKPVSFHLSLCSVFSHRISLLTAFFFHINLAAVHTKAIVACVCYFVSPAIFDVHFRINILVYSLMWSHFRGVIWFLANAFFFHHAWRM